MKSHVLITGSAPCLADDLKLINPEKFDCIAVGMDAIMNHGLSIDYVATYHPKDIQAIKDLMKKNRPGDTYRIISHKPGSNVDLVIPYEPPSGSSALLATLAAIKLGYKKIVLAGCPLQGDNPNIKNARYDAFQKGWIKKRDEIKDCVRSLSGWTADFLGKPDDEWLMNDKAIDINHQSKFEQVWDKGDYRRGSTAQRLVNRLLQSIPESAVINDYGSGTGRAEVEIIKRRPNQKINMVDIARNALENEARALISETVTFTHADLSDLSLMPVADWGMCINVLMTVQPEKLDSILSEIRRTCKNLFFEAYDLQDVRLGNQMTTVQMNRERWENKLSKYWPEVKFEKSPESDHRYIFVCQSEEQEQLTGTIQDLRGKHRGENCYIIGRGPSLLSVKKEDFGPGPVIVLNEAIINVHDLNLDNPIYSQWRNGDVLPNLKDYLKDGDAMLLCDNPVLNDPPSSTLFKDYLPRYSFECLRDFGKNPQIYFSHKAAIEVAVKIFGCSSIISMGFDSYRGEQKTVLKAGFVQSEHRPGAYNEQIEIVKRRLSELPHIDHIWFFPESVDKVRLNLGCGPVKEQGYINIDLHDESADVHMDVTALEYDDNSVDEIYSSHLLEHFGFMEVPAVLREWARVLKPSGLLKMNLPNLEWCLKNWLEQPEDKRWGYPLKTIFGNQSNPGEYHKTGFSKDSLNKLLSAAGFVDISIDDHWSHNQQCFMVECKKKDYRASKPVSNGKVTVITLTGDRPEAFSLCEKWMKAQTRKPDQWIVVDDGKKKMKAPENCHYIRREPKKDDPQYTMILNMQTSIKHITGDFILIMEDDEYYAPEYIESIVERLNKFEVAGVGRSKYYHIGIRRYTRHMNLGHASLAQTGFRKSFLPEFEALLDGDQFLDIRIWRALNGSCADKCDAKDLNEKERITKDKRGIVFDDGTSKCLYVGIKGLPGRAGIGSGHKKEAYAAYNTDNNYSVLSGWLNNNDALRTYSKYGDK